MTKGVFITFEGTEGNGKSTQAARLAGQLRRLDADVVDAREPGGTLIGEDIRGMLKYDRAGESIVPETELLLFEASRAQLVKQVIEPALLRGAWVVCDRFVDSTTAYQGYGRGFDVEKLLALHALATGGTMPDLTFLLDSDVEIGFQRLRERNRSRQLEEDRFEKEAMDFHRKIRAGYLELAERWPKRFRIIDASRDADSVYKAIWKEVEATNLLQRGTAP